MSQKKGWDIPNFKLYTVYPLQGYWGIQDQYLNAPVMKKNTLNTLSALNNQVL